MNEVEYLVYQKKLLLVASLLRDLDLERFLRSTACSEETWVFDTSTASPKTREHVLEIARGALRFMNGLPKEEQDEHRPIPGRRGP